MAVPGVAPAAKVVAVVPVPAVCPLVGSSGGVPATPLGGVVVTAHVTAAPPRGTPCKFCIVAVTRSVPPVVMLALAAFTARLPAMPVSIRKRIGRVRPSLSTTTSPVASSFTCPGVVVSNTSANPSSRRAPLAPAVTCTRYVLPGTNPSSLVSQFTWYVAPVRSILIAGVLAVV